jgi:hypothetical protein
VPEGLQQDDDGHVLSAPVRTVAAAAGRSICLYLCAELAEGTDPALVTGLVEAFDVELFLTGREIAYLLEEPGLTERRAEFAAAIYSCEALLWAIRRLEGLTSMTADGDFGAIATPLLALGSWQSVAAGAALRDQEQLADALRVARSGPVSPASNARVNGLAWLLDREARGWDVVSSENPLP